MEDCQCAPPVDSPLPLEKLRNNKLLEGEVPRSVPAEDSSVFIEEENVHESSDMRRPRSQGVSDYDEDEARDRLGQMMSSIAVEPIEQDDRVDQEKEEKEEEDDEEMAVVRDFASHPMMERVQKKLVETLAREYERTALETKEKLQASHLEKKKREELGVELYGVQQQLAKLQLTLESRHNDANQIQEKLASEEVKAQRRRSEYASLHQALAERNQQVQKGQAELDAINNTLRQVEKYNTDMHKEIALTKRAAYKTEETVSALENAKKDQDFYIDTLEQRVKALNEAIGVHQTQLERQELASKDAKGMLTETAEEMNLIHFEKKQLVQQWKASLVQLARRDEALAAANKTLDAAKIEIQDISADIEATRRQIQTIQNETDTATAIKERHTAEEHRLVQASQALKTQAEGLNEQLQVLQRSMAHTKEEETKLAEQNKSSGDSLDQLSANIQIVTIERQKLEERIENARSAQTTVSKAVKNIQKETALVRQAVNAKEIEEAKAENECVRVRIDIANTKAHNEQLSETLKGMLGKLKQQDNLIAKYQQEIRQRNDDVEKKMTQVDRLNRKYEKMVANLEQGEHLGPLEATIRNLTKERDLALAENAKLQESWLADQTALVVLTQESETLTEHSTDLKARARILEEKRLRLIQESAKHASRIGALNLANAAARKDVARINELLGRHSIMHDDLANEIAVIEMEFQSELRELEVESLSLERRVVETKNTKAKLLDEIVEIERQVLLWEKKIQLEKETQAALNPTVGANEIKAMEMEIHRMKLRLEAIHREQEHMIADMERAITKREAISLKFSTTGKNKKAISSDRLSKSQHQRPRRANNDYTQAGLKKQVAQLRYSIQQTAEQASTLSQQIQTKQRNLQASTASLAQATVRYSELEQTSARLQASINTLLYEKQRRAEMQSAHDKSASRFLDLERGTITILTDDDATEVDARLQAASDQNGSIKQLITDLSSKFHYLSEPLQRIFALADDANIPPISGTTDLSIPGDTDQQ